MKYHGMSARTCQAFIFCLACSFLLLSCTGCSLFPSDQPVTLEVAWRLPMTGVDTCIAPLVVDDIMYAPWAEKLGLKAIRLSDGVVLWEISQIGYIVSNPVKIGNDLFLASEYKGETTEALYRQRFFRIGCDGTKKGEIDIGGLEMMPRMFSIAARGSKIYWPTWGNGYAVLDSNDTTNVSEKEYGTPTMLFQGPKSYIGSPGLFLDGNIYIVWEADLFMEPTKIIRFEEVSGALTATWPLPIALAASNESQPAIPYNGTLTIIGARGVYGIGMDGAVRWRVDNANHGGAASSNNVSYQNNMAYYTTTASNEVSPDASNIVAFDMGAGRLKWGASVSGSCGSMPQVNNGIFYATTQTKVILFDAETGRQLGVDSSIHGDNWQLNASYKRGDLFIFQNGDEIIAFRMNYKLDGFGNLVK